MEIKDIVILVLFSVAVAAAVISLIADRKKGKNCCGDCSRCKMNCKK